MPRHTTVDPLLQARRRFREEPDPDIEWWQPDAPAPDPDHWAAVGRAISAVTELDGDVPGADGEASWNQEQAAMRTLARGYASPVPTPDDGYELVALLPPPPGTGPRWVAVSVHPQYDDVGFWSLGEDAIRIDRVAPLPIDAAAVWHIAAQTLVPVLCQPFVDITPELFESTGYGEERWQDWHEAEDFASLPHEPEVYGLASALHRGSKIGGLPTFGAEDRQPPSCPDRGGPMDYAYALASDFFDVRFGDAGVLHVWLSETRASCLVDSA